MVPLSLGLHFDFRARPGPQRQSQAAAMPTREPPEPRFSYENWPRVVLGVISEQAELCSQTSPKHKVIPAGPQAESPWLLGSPRGAPLQRSRYPCRKRAASDKARAADGVGACLAGPRGLWCRGVHGLPGLGEVGLGTLGTHSLQMRLGAWGPARL